MDTYAYVFVTVITKSRLFETKLQLQKEWLKKISFKLTIQFLLYPPSKYIQAHSHPIASSVVDLLKRVDTIIQTDVKLIILNILKNTLRYI